MKLKIEIGIEKKSELPVIENCNTKKIRITGNIVT